jgi:major membrane immunogen (membrane-anchored lipoprotein)
MLKIRRTFIESSLLILLLITLFLLVSVSGTAQGPTEIEGISSGPVYKDFMGVTLGMPVDEVRAKLGDPKHKGERQDFFVFSESQSAQVVYDDQGKVVVISVDYEQKDGKVPPPESVLGEAVQAKKDGSMYQLKRYPEAGFWVAYNRTAGDDPIVTITIQRM